MNLYDLAKDQQDSLSRIPRVVSSLAFVLGQLRHTLRRAVSFPRSTLAFQIVKVMRRGAPMQVDIGGAPVLIERWGSIALSYWKDGGFDARQTDAFLELLTPSSVVVDVGSNVGLYALPVGVRFPRAAVDAIEPSPETVQHVRRNLDLNGLSNVAPFQVALSDSDGLQTLTLNADMRDGLDTLGTPHHPLHKVVGEVEAETLTLDSFVARAGIVRVDFMKVDVEGAEKLVFAGGQRLLSRSDAPVILFENDSWCTKQFGYHPVENVRILESYGYDVRSVDPKTGRLVTYPCSPDYRDMVLAFKPGFAKFVDLSASSQ